MSARQRLQKRCDALRRRKLSNIGTLLEIPAIASPNYYSLTSLDGSNTVWSPSSRGYSASRHQSGESSPVSNSSSTLSSPTTTQTSPQKSRLLSPKMEQILQNKIRQDSVDAQKTPSRQSVRPRVTQSTPIITTANKTPTGGMLTSKAEAVKLASLLQTTPPLGPVEITGHADSLRDRANTLEVGEELVEESITLADSSSSFILINDSAAVQHHSENTPTKVKHSSNTTNNNEMTIRASKSVSKDTRSKYQHLDNSNFMNISLDRPNNSPLLTLTVDSEKENSIGVLGHRKKSESAPGSPRGRRHRSKDEGDDETEKLSKSLPAMALTSSIEERKQRAQRARAKAKNAAAKKGGKKSSRK